jgi:hypothetical protein
MWLLVACCDDDLSELHQSQIGSDSVGLPGSLYWVPDLTAAGESESGEDGDDGEEAEHRGSAV